MMGKVIIEETYFAVKNRIRESALYSSGKDFYVKGLSEELSLCPDFITQVIREMFNQGDVTRQRESKKGLKGSTYRYRKLTFTPRDFLAMPLRKHTNDQLQLEPTHCWAIM